jgi:arylsulfatase A-like enzyme
LIVTDDQGYGDLGCHGNTKIKTPNIDKFAKESMQLRHFYVSPVCSPTRSSLMTGRYNYRTGVVDTFLGRSMMHPDETTIAEILAANGYRTGIFGKWHLGDNYPLRAMDQGFEVSLVLKGGGLGQPSDIPGDGSYFNPKLLKNGKVVQTHGYVSDVLTEAAINFVTAKSDKPFFTYLAFNCPHTPLEVKDEDVKPYKAMDLGLDQFPQIGFPIRGKYSEDDTAKIYGMVSNIDANLGLLFKKLDDAKLADNTLVIFLTDNGPQQPRWNAGFRGLKGTVYEGGVRVPFYARWPGKFTAGKESDVVAAHIDVLPTILAACGLAAPRNLKLDGIDLLAALKGENYAPPDRAIYLQWHRGDLPELGRACMARGPRYKIVQPLGVQEGKSVKDAAFELYDIIADPYEQKNLAAEKPEIVKAMRAGYETWFADVKKERNFQLPRIHLGSDKENPSVLTRQDMRGPNAGWTPKAHGHWDVFVERPGKYRVTIFMDPTQRDRTAHVGLGDATRDMQFGANKSSAMAEFDWKKGDGPLEAWVKDGKERFAVKYLEVERLGD